MRFYAFLIAACCVQANPLSVEVLAQEDVYTFVPSNNGSGPLWSHGCTSIVRSGSDVLVSQMETGDDVPPLCNTRWRLLRRTNNGWECVGEADQYRQREPASLATTGPGHVFVNVNDSIEPPGTHYGRTRPHLVRFDLTQESSERRTLVPTWDGGPYFTDHSYRGYAADPARDELLMLNIDAQTSVEHACLMNASGETVATGSITFPIRACYPQVQLTDRAVHVLAVSDIVEPVEAWRAYKKEKTGRDWDYVFRILYYAHTPDLTAQDFGVPLEVANVDATGGHISNKDLWAAPDGSVYIMYTAREVATPMMSRKFFPDKSTLDSLYLAVVRDGAVVRRETLVDGTKARQSADARFHVAADGRLYALIYVSGRGGMNLLMPIAPAIGEPIPVPLPRPIAAFSTASPRAGCAPSDTIDILGQMGRSMVYAAVQLRD